MSPVHDQSYRRYAGTRRPVGRAWAVIAWNGIRALIGKRVLLGLLVLAWLPFIVRTIQIYIVTAYPQARDVLPVNPRMFQQFVEFQSLFTFFVTIYVGAGLIANDRRANALQLYLSKPLMRAEYIAGKLGVLMAFLAIVTVLPGVTLLLMQPTVSGSLAFLRENPSVIPAVILSSLVRVVVASFTMLALSALSTSTRYVAVMYTGIIFFSEAVYGVLRVATGSTRIAWVSLTANFDVVNDAIFRQTPRYDTPVIVSVLILTGLVTLSVSVLEQRVRGVEVVS